MLAAIFRAVKPLLILISLLAGLALLLLLPLSVMGWLDDPFHVHIQRAQDLKGYCTRNAILETPGGSIGLNKGVAHLAGNEGLIGICEYSRGQLSGIGRRRLKGAEVYWSGSAEKEGCIICDVDAVLTFRGWKITRIYSTDPLFRDLFFTDNSREQNH